MNKSRRMNSLLKFEKRAKGFTRELLIQRKQHTSSSGCSVFLSVFVILWVTARLLPVIENPLVFRTVVCREFDEELVRTLVDKIYLGGDNTLRVVFRFQDVFSEFQECLEGVTKHEE